MTNFFLVVVVIHDVKATVGAVSTRSWFFESIINKSNLNTQHKPQGDCLDSVPVSLFCSCLRLKSSFVFLKPLVSPHEMT
jgi:hypothetical protein